MSLPAQDHLEYERAGRFSLRRSYQALAIGTVALVVAVALGATAGRLSLGSARTDAATASAPAGTLAPAPSDQSTAKPASQASPGAKKKWQPPPRDNWAGHGFDPTNPAGCDPLDPAQCMLPYPNDWFTKPDPSSATGRRLDLTLLAMPRNAAGKPIETQEWNRSDGFSAGAQILTVVPGMTDNSDLVRSGLPPVTDLGLNSAPNLGVVLLDEETGQLWPVWVEIDQYTQESGVEPSTNVQQDLMIHPARNLNDGHRYIVALRHLVTDTGAEAQPAAAFLAYRDGSAPAADPRKAHMERIFSTLAQAGIARGNLYLAWDFTTASTKNVTGRLLAMRNDAFAQLGATPADLARGKLTGRSPSFTVDSVTNYTAADNADIARQITGHFTVPCYLFPSCEPPTKCTATGIFNDCPTPSQFLLDPTNPDAVPQQVGGQTYQANYICNVGRAAFEQHLKLRPVEYGHGLFGSASEVNSDAETSMAARFGMMYCATDWTGWATADVPNAVIALTDVSRFPLLADRGQQGELNFLYLARVMIHPQGFSSNPAFQYDDGSSFIDTRQPFYDGNSQGGIFGGTVCAVSVDVRRCVLGVNGMDYSVLLPRSSDYVAQQPVTSYDPTSGSLPGYSNVFDTAYPDQSQRMLILDLLQTLWDRADPNGYATHMTGGLPNTPTHHVLSQIGYGDHQVANITAEDEARTIGAGGIYPPLEPARYGPYQDVFWAIPSMTQFPYDGSAIVLFDTGPVRPASLQACGHNGTDPPPTSDTPNRSGDDPHEAPRRAPWGQQQKSDFMQIGGLVTNPQPGGAPYFAWCWDGVAGL